jgi:hypothetical protein
MKGSFWLNVSLRGRFAAADVGVMFEELAKMFTGKSFSFKRFREQSYEILLVFDGSRLL